MRILVTGGAGFIGSQYVRALLGDEYRGYEGAHVTVVDKLTYAGNRANLPGRHRRLTFIHDDITDHDTMRVVAGHDAVVHFAAESHVDRSLQGATEFVQTNVAGTHSVLNACQAAGVRMVHVSTDEVYGSISDGSWTEDWPLRPNSPYSATKAGADLLALAYAHSYGLDVRVTRCSNNYGPYQHTEKLIPLFITNLLSGQPVPLYGDGANVREWVHVADHARAIQLVLTGGRQGEVYNIGGTAMSNRAMTERLLGYLGANWSSVRRVPDRKGHDLRYALDDAKIRTELGYRPQIPLEIGLAEVVRWYRDNPAWWKTLATAV